MRELDRREFLRLAGVTLGAAAFPVGFAAPARAQDAGPSRYKTRHVVLVAFAGGVRSRDTIRTPENVPNLMKIAKEGAILPRVAVKNIGHYAAALSIFTGQHEDKHATDGERSDSPTVFEYVRKQRNLDEREAWLATSGGDQQLNYACSTSADYGARYGATPIAPEGLFNAELKPLVEKFGRPRAEDPRDREKVAELAKALDPDGRPATREDQPARQRLERVALDELSGGTTGLTGAGAGDARAIRVAKNVLLAFHPTLVGIALSNADVAHGNTAGYVEVLRRNDQELGALWAAIQADPDLKGTTSLLVVPELGRDAELNQRQGLDHTDASRDVLEVAGFAAGPDFRRDAVLSDVVRSTQVCPTVCELLGAVADRTKEKPIRELFA